MYLTLPLAVPVSKNKKFILNLNNYRSAHYRTIDKAKRIYTAIVQQSLKEAYPKHPTIHQCSITYLYYHGNRRKIDISNPCSIIDKFACDALTKSGLWVDDNTDVVMSVKYEWAGVDKTKPRCVMIIDDLDSDATIS